MSTLDHVVLIEVLHNDQAPRYSIVSGGDKFGGMVSWREFMAHVDHVYSSADAARRALAELVLCQYNEARQRATNRASVQLVGTEVSTASKAIDDAEIRNFCTTAVLMRDHAKRPGVHARVADGSHLFFAGKYANPLLGKLGAVVAICAARIGASLDHITATAPFVINCRSLRRERDGALLCAVSNGLAAELPHVGTIVLSGKYVQQFAASHDIVFYMTSDLVPGAVPVPLPRKRKTNAQRRIKEQQPPPLAQPNQQQQEQQLSEKKEEPTETLPKPPIPETLPPKNEATVWY